MKSESKIDTFYNVDMTSGYYDCRSGSNCGPGAIAKFKNIAKFNILPKTDSKIRALYHYIADGTFCTNELYRDLDNPNGSTNESEFAEVRTTTASSSNNLI